MSDRFGVCIKFVLDHETEYDGAGNARCEHDPNDPGGDTKYGIDQRSHPRVQVCDLTLEQAEQIYHDGEWTRCRCDELSAPWDLAVFDAAVNVGPAWAVPALQRAVGVTPDGFIGPQTIAAVNAAPSGCEGYLVAREDYYRSLKFSLRQRYLKGWLNRVADLRIAIAA